MKPPTPIVAFKVPEWERLNFDSLHEMEVKTGVSAAYITQRKNTGKICKGWFIYDVALANLPETMERVGEVCAEINSIRQRKQADKDPLVSVRIDAKTVILIRRSKLTPDTAERYRNKLADNRSAVANGFIQRNDKINKTKPGKGRPKKYK